MSLNPPNRQQLLTALNNFATALQNFGQQEQNFYGYVNGQSLAYLQNGLFACQVFNGGGGYGNSTTTVTIDVPAGQPNTQNQQQATATLVYAIDTIALNAAGLTYGPGDVLTLSGGGGAGGLLQVDTVDGSGRILTFHKLNGGSGYTIATGVGCTGGSGSGATFNITGLRITMCNLVLVGSGYGSITPPNVNVTDSGSGAGAQITAILANTDNALNFLPADAASIKQDALDLYSHYQVTNGLCQSSAGVATVQPHSGAAGTGFSNGEVLTVVQTGGKGCTLTITGASGGVPTTLAVTTPGEGYIVANNVSTTGGSGSGCHIDILTLQGVVVSATPGYNFTTNVYASSGI